MITDVLIETLSALQTVQGMKYVGMDCGQLEQERPSVKFPCVLVGLRTLEVSETSGQDLDEGTLSIRVAWTYTVPVSGNSPYNELTLGGFNLIGRVRNLLWHRRFSFGHLRLTGIERTNDLFNGTEIWTMTYRFVAQA